MNERARDAPIPSLKALIDDLIAIGAWTPKNPDLFANLERRGDWDIVVRDLEEAQSRLISRLGYPDRFEQRSYVRSYFYLPWGSIDLLPNWQWNGVPILEAAQLEEGMRTGPTGMPRLSLANEALMLWIQKLLWGGRTEPRYAAAITEAAQIEPTAFESGASQIFGSRIGRQLSEYAKRGEFDRADQIVNLLRIATTVRGMCRRPYVTVAGFMNFVLAELTLRSSPATPLIEVGNVGRDASRLRDVTTTLWPVVAGVTTLGHVDRNTAAGALRHVFRYWSRGSKARSRGTLVVVPVLSCGASRTARLVNRLAPRAEFSLGADPADWDKILDELLRHARATARIRLRPEGRFRCLQSDGFVPRA